MTDTMTIAEEGSRLDDNQPPLTNLYSKDELGRIRHAVKTYQRIKKEVQRHREDWLKVVGPALVMVRDKAIEVSGTAKTSSQAYRDAIGEELNRTGLDIIDGAARSYLLRIMDNLEEVQAWLSARPNPDRLNHPKTIWKAFYQLGLRDDPGADHEDTEEYYGEEPDDREKVDCAKCGRKQTADFVVRKDGSFYCDVCHNWNPEQDDDDDAGDDDAGGDDDDKGDDDTGRDDDHDDNDHDAGDDHDASGDDDEGMPERTIYDIGELQSYIKEALKRGAHRHNLIFQTIPSFRLSEGHLDPKAGTRIKVHFVSPYMIITGDNTPTPASNGHGNTFLETKLRIATDEREAALSENATLKLIIAGMTKQLAGHTGHTGHPMPEAAKHG